MIKIIKNKKGKVSVRKLETLKGRLSVKEP